MPGITSTIQDCGDQILRNFLIGLTTKYRPGPDDRLRPGARLDHGLAPPAGSTPDGERRCVPVRGALALVTALILLLGACQPAPYRLNQEHQSASQNERIAFLILHYTDEEDARSLRLLTEPEHKVSAHYLIPATPTSNRSRSTSWCPTASGPGTPDAVAGITTPGSTPVRSASR